MKDKKDRIAQGAGDCHEEIAEALQIRHLKIEDIELKLNVHMAARACVTFFVTEQMLETLVKKGLAE